MDATDATALAAPQGANDSPFAIHDSRSEAPLRFAWQTEVSAPKPFRARAFHGESFTLACTPLQYAKPLAGLSGAAVALRWQTDGMDPDEWYEAPGAYDPATGELSADWGPDCDTGADRVRFFLALETPGGASFRAFGTLDLAPSPGFTPAQRLPESQLDKLRDALADETRARQQADNALETALDQKAEKTHTHTTAQVTGLDAKLNAKADAAHTHTTAQVAGLDAALAKKANATDVYKKSETYSRAEVDGKVAGVYHYKGSVANRAALPAAPAVGDVYNIAAEDGQNVAWTGSAWDALGATVDLSAYDTAQTTQGKITAAVAPKANSADVYPKTQTYTKTEVDNLVAQAVANAKAELLEQLKTLYAPLSSVQATVGGTTYRWAWDDTFQTFAMMTVAP